MIVLIESGQLESATHVEQMAVDMGRHFRAFYPEARDSVAQFETLPFLRRMRVGGRLLFEMFGRDAYLNADSRYGDIARGWQAFAIAQGETDAREAFSVALPFIKDPHFAVREFIWLAMRPHIQGDVEQSINCLVETTDFTSEYEARFAIEATRPRSVWGPHIPELKKQPELGETLIALAAQNSALYVSKSIANWIRDASKTRPDWAARFSIEIAEKTASPSLHRRLLKQVEISHHNPEPGTQVPLEGARD